MTDADYVEMARQDYAFSDRGEKLRIVDAAGMLVVSRETGGAWVAAQVWVDDKRFSQLDGVR